MLICVSLVAGLSATSRLGTFIFSWFFMSLLLSLDVIGGGSTMAHMVGAACMGVFWQQLAGIGHDLGHSGVTHNFHLDHQIGSVMSSILGLSLCWWKSDHNTHHVVCNVHYATHCNTAPPFFQNDAKLAI